MPSTTISNNASISVGRTSPELVNSRLEQLRNSLKAQNSTNNGPAAPSLVSAPKAPAPTAPAVVASGSTESRAFNVGTFNADEPTPSSVVTLSDLPPEEAAALKDLVYSIQNQTLKNAQSVSSEALRSSRADAIAATAGAASADPKRAAPKIVDADLSVEAANIARQDLAAKIGSSLVAKPNRDAGETLKLVR